MAYESKNVHQFQSSQKSVSFSTDRALYILLKDHSEFASNLLNEKRWLFGTSLEHLWQWKRKNANKQYSNLTFWVKYERKMVYSSYKKPERKKPKSYSSTCFEKDSDFSEYLAWTKVGIFVCSLVFDLTSKHSTSFEEDAYCWGYQAVINVENLLFDWLICWKTIVPVSRRTHVPSVSVRHKHSEKFLAFVDTIRKH